jgi:arylsulfatase
MSTSATRRPNVLFITTDEQRYDTLGILGNRQVRTPNLDALAARGSVFRRGYIQNTVCIPSRACLMTGRYVHQHGVEYMEPEIGTTPGLPPWETTVMERLQEAGYTTAAFGKIHQMPPRGWDETGLTLGKGARWTVAGKWRDGMDDAEESPLGPAQLGPVYAEWLERKRPGAYESIYAQRRRPEYREQAQAVVNTLAADEYVDYWIGENTWRYLERPETGSAERPFFLWCGFCGPHGPFDPPEPYASMYDQGQILPSPTLRARQQNAPGAARQSRFDKEDGEALARKITAYYWGMVTFIDDMVGRIMEVLTRRNLWENTLVVFTTDHGEMLGDFGRLGKEVYHESVTRVPYLVVPPGSQSGAGGRGSTSSPQTAETGGRTAESDDGAGPRFVDSFVEHIDLVPTILDYAGIPQPRELPGMSLRPVLEDPSGSTTPTTRDSVLCEHVTNDRQVRTKCVRTDRYKLIYGGPQEAFENGQSIQLYDLERDPLETTNVAGDPSYSDVVQRHLDLLLHRLSWSESTPWNSGGAAKARPAEDVDHWGRPIGR